MTQPFHFPNGQLAHNAEDLLELCQQHPDEATNHLVRQDLEKWLAYIGSYELAESAVNARQTDLEDRQKLEEFLNKSRSLISSKAVPAAVSETQIKDNLTAPESATTTTEIPSEDSSSSVVTEPVEPATPPKKLAESSDTQTASQPDEPVVDESKDLAVAESTLIENEDEEINDTATASQPDEPVVDESKDLAVAESTLDENSEQTTPTATATVNKTPGSRSESKPSFFQVIARFIVKILYRNKA